MRQSIRIDRKNIIKCFVVLFIGYATAVWYYTGTYSKEGQNVLGGLVILVSLLLIHEYRSNIGLLLVFVFIAYANYSVVVGVYWFPGIRPNSLYRQITNDKVYAEAILSMLYFVLVLYVLKLLSPQESTKDIRFAGIKLFEGESRRSELLSWVCIICFILIFAMTFRFRENARATTSVVSEYRYLFMIVSAMYATRKKQAKTVWTIIIAVTASLTFLGGNRVNALPTVFLLILLWYPTVDRKYILLLPVAVIMLQLIGNMRYSVSFSIENLIETGKTAFEEKLTSDTFTFAFFPSVCSIDLADRLNSANKLAVLGKNLVYIFAGGQYGKYVLPTFTRQYYVHYYGFFAPLTCNFYVGIAGAFILAVVTHLYVRCAAKVDWKNNPSGWEYAISAVFVGIVSRWYIYNYWQLMRGTLIISVLFLLFKVADRITANKMSNK